MPGSRVQIADPFPMFNLLSFSPPPSQTRYLLSILPPPTIHYGSLLAPSRSAPLHLSYQAMGFSTHRSLSSSRWIWVAFAVVLTVVVTSQKFTLSEEVHSFSNTSSSEAITILLNSDKYLPAVVALSNSLERYSPNRDRIALIPNTHTISNISKDVMQKTGWEIRSVDHIPIPLPTSGDIVRPQYESVMNKLHIWNLVEYSRVAFLDLDLFLTGPIDEPFRLLQSSSLTVASVPDIDMSATKTWSYPFKGNLNSGTMWVKPNTTIYSELVEYSRDTSHYLLHTPSQSMLSQYFAGAWLGLPVQYNLMFLFIQSQRENMYNNFRQAASVVHFAAEVKPWSGCQKFPYNVHVCKEIHPDIQLWRDNLKEGMSRFGVSLEEIIQGRTVDELSCDMAEVTS